MSNFIGSGVLANANFGQKTLPKKSFIFADNLKESVKSRILDNFDEILFKHEGGYFERYIVRVNDMEYILVFQVVGAPMIIDILHILKDGSVDEVIFLGAAYGITESLNVCDCVIPTVSQALEGVLKTLENIDYSYPNEELNNRVMDKLKHKNKKFQNGKVVSVTSSFAQPSWKLFDKDVDVLEMETSCLFHYSKKLNLKSSGILIISDTKKHKIYDTQEDRYDKTIDIFRSLIEE